jgi:hypothetical protein
MCPVYAYLQAYICVCVCVCVCVRALLYGCMDICACVCMAHVYACMIVCTHKHFAYSHVCRFACEYAKCVHATCVYATCVHVCVQGRDRGREGGVCMYLHALLPTFLHILSVLLHYCITNISCSIQRILILPRFAYPLTYYPFCWVLLLTAYLLHMLFHKSTSLYTSGNISIILFSPDTHMRVW